MADGEGFIQAVVENPADDGLRLIYSDWLEERGDPRGEYLRLECALTSAGQSNRTTGQTHSDRQRLDARLQELRSTIDADWLILMDRSGLIQRLKDRIKDPNRVRDMDIGFTTIHPPATETMIRAAEKSLGFRLPPLLRQVFMQVGNGGFGPDYGIAGVDRGEEWAVEEWSLIDLYHACIQGRLIQAGLVGEVGPSGWPKGVIPFCNMGCGAYHCIDCKPETGPIILYEPNVGPEDHFEPMFDSLSEWFEQWLGR